MAVLKRLKFAAKSEAFTPEQKSLIEETLDTDLAALAAEIDAQQPAQPERKDRQVPKRAPLPADLPRREVSHEPEDTTCGCGQAMKRIGQDVAEKLDYVPGVFTVERHVRGEQVCACCQSRGEGRLVQAPVAARIIDKGLPTTGPLAQVPDPTHCHRQKQLAVRQQSACGQASRSGDEPGALDAAERARAARVPARCARASAHAASQPHRRVDATSLAATAHRRLRARPVVKTGSPDAY